MAGFNTGGLSLGGCLFKGIGSDNFSVGIDDSSFIHIFNLAKIINFADHCDKTCANFCITRSAHKFV